MKLVSSLNGHCHKIIAHLNWLKVYIKRIDFMQNEIDRIKKFAENDVADMGGSRNFWKGACSLSLLFFFNHSVRRGGIAVP